MTGGRAILLVAADTDPVRACCESTVTAGTRTEVVEDVWLYDLAMPVPFVRDVELDE